MKHIDTIRKILHNTPMQEFFKQNFWNFMVTLVAVSIGWGALSSRIQAIETQTMENEQKIVQYSQLVERVVRLEENRQVISESLKDIKEDIKDLKKHFNLQ